MKSAGCHLHFSEQLKHMTSISNDLSCHSHKNNFAGVFVCEGRVLATVRSVRIKNSISMSENSACYASSVDEIQLRNCRSPDRQDHLTAWNVISQQSSMNCFLGDSDAVDCDDEVTFLQKPCVVSRTSYHHVIDCKAFQHQADLPPFSRLMIGFTFFDRLT